MWHLNLHNTFSKLVLFRRDELCYTVMMVAIAKLSSHFIHALTKTHLSKTINIRNEHLRTNHDVLWLASTDLLPLNPRFKCRGVWVHNP